MEKIKIRTKFKFVIRGIQRQIFNWKGRLARFALIEYYASLGLYQHETAIINISPGFERLKVGGEVAAGAFSIIWIGDDPLGAKNEGRILFGFNIYIGDHCNIRAAGGAIEIGNNVLIANGVTIVAANHGTSLVAPMINQPWETSAKGVRIGSDVWIGAHAIILPGSQIENGAIIAAGAVVRGSVPANTIYGGIPAKFIRNRGEK